MASEVVRLQDWQVKLALEAGWLVRDERGILRWPSRQATLWGVDADPIRGADPAEELAPWNSPEADAAFDRCWRAHRAANAARAVQKPASRRLFGQHMQATGWSAAEMERRWRVVLEHTQRDYIPMTTTMLRFGGQKDYLSDDAQDGILARWEQERPRLEAERREAIEATAERIRRPSDFTPEEERRRRARARSRVGGAA